MLPKKQTVEFERTHLEKLSFDRSMEQLGTRSIVTSVLVAANIAWFVIVATQGGGWFVPQPGVIIQWGSDFGPLTLSREYVGALEHRAVGGAPVRIAPFRALVRVCRALRKLGEPLVASQHQ